MDMTCVISSGFCISNPYVVIDPGMTTAGARQLLTDEQYYEALEEYRR